jgi:hypothetical protein
MGPHGINILSLHKFIDASRAYFALISKAKADAEYTERRSPGRLVASGVIALHEFQKTGYQENAPA